MKQLTCEMCGSTDIIKQDGVFVCQTCGCKYSVEEAKKMMSSLGLEPRIVIDCSHQNSRKDYRRQKRVLRSIVDQVRWGEDRIRGFMLESNIKEGCQKIGEDLSALEYGVSVTDACIGWEETERIVLHAADIIRKAYTEGTSEEIL